MFSTFLGLYIKASLNPFTNMPAHKSDTHPLTRGQLAAFWIASFTPLAAFMQNRLRIINESKLFAGLVMLMLNIGSRYISLPFGKSAEEFLRANLGSPMLIFAVAWMGTRDIYMSLGLTGAFVL